MGNINNEYIVEYVRGLVPDRNELFQDMEDYAAENHVPIVEPEVAQLIRVILKMNKPKKILEVGTAIGYSALVMCDALNGDVKVTSIERNEDIIPIAKENIRKSGFEDQIEIINADAEEIISKLSDRYDMIFIDASKGHYMQFFEDSRKLLDDKGIIISDNVLFRGMVASDELVKRRKITIVKRLRKYLKYINNIDGFTTTVLPVGDGVAITYKEV